MDLVDKEDPKRKRYNERKELLMGLNEKVEKEVEERGRHITCFPTSIWDESLYKVLYLTNSVSMETGLN